MMLLRAAITLALIAALLWWLGDDEASGVAKLSAVLSRAALGWIAVAFAVSTLDRMMMTLKWRLLLRIRGLHLDFWRGLRIYCTSTLWGALLPSTVGADALRAGMAMRAGLPGNDVVASIVVERIIGFLCSLYAALLGLLVVSTMADLRGPWMSLWWIGSLALAAAIGAVALTLSRSLFDRIVSALPERIRDLGPLRQLRRFHSIYVDYYSDGRSLIAFGALTFAEIFVSILMTWACAVALHVDVGLLFFAAALQLTLLVARLPVSIDGFGVFEGVLAGFLLMVGVPKEEAVAIALLGRVVQTASWLPWWIAHSFSTRELRPPADLPTQGG